MKRGTFPKYGSTRTTFSGNVEREDAQPNEGLIRKRTSGPPALKPTVPPPVRSSQGRWGQVGYKGRPWSRPANQRNQDPPRPATGSNSAGPSQNRYPSSNTQSDMAHSSASMPRRGPVRSHEDLTQIPPRHNKRQKTSHESMETSRDAPPHWQHAKPSSAPPLPHRTPNDAPCVLPPSQHLPTPSASASPLSPYTFNPTHGILPVPPLPSRASRRSPPIAPIMHTAISHPNTPYQPPGPHVSSTPMPIQLPSSSLLALNRIGIYPIPKEQLRPPFDPQPAAVLLGQSPDAAILNLEINMSKVPISQMTNLAALLRQLTSRHVPAPRPPPVPPQAPVSPTTRWGLPTQTRFVQPPPQKALPPPPPPVQVVSPPAAPSAKKARPRPPPLPATRPVSPPSPREVSIISCTLDSSQPLPSASPSHSPRQSRNGIPTPVPPHSPPIPRKVKTEPGPVSLFCSTPLPPSTSYTRPGEMVIEPRRLVRQACTRFILPNDCHDDYNPRGFHAARIAFLKEKRKELKSKGLNVERKVVVREDGLVLEWTSPVPVWTDTFLPEAGTDLVSAINETSIGNARSAARASKQNRSNSVSTPAPGPVIVLDHSPPPSPRPAPPVLQEPPQAPISLPVTHAPEPGPEPTDEPEPPPSRKVVRPSQVIPPNPHPPKRSFKPVHVSRSLASANTSSDSGGLKAKGDHPGGESREPTPAIVAPEVPVLPEPTQPTPVPSPTPTPAPVSVPAIAANSNDGLVVDGGLEYVDDEANLDIVSPPLPPVEGPTQLRPSPVCSDSNSSMERDIVSQILNDPLKQGTRELSPPAQIAFIKSEEDEVVDLTLPVSHGDNAPPTNDPSLSSPIKMEVDDDEEGSEGSVEGDDVLELARQFLLRYMDSFDHDRSQLDEAYSHDATFSISIHDDTGGKEASMASTFCTEARPNAQRRSNTSNAPACKTVTRVYRGRQGIIDRLRSLGPHKFLSPRLPHAHPSPIYDIVSYPIFESSSPSTSAVGPLATQSPTEHCGELVLASLHSEAVNTTRMSRSVVMDHIVTVDQNFVLRLRCEMDVPVKQEEGVSGGNFGVNEDEPWPLVVLSHQMVVRDGPMLRQGEVEDVLPWVFDIKAANVQCD